MSKYNNKKVEVNGIKFPSKLEASYYEYLLEQQEQGLIKSFDMQVPFILLDGYELEGDKAQPIKLVLDFIVYYEDGRVEYQDTKGQVKPMDIVKKKLFESRYNKKLIFIGKSLIDGGYVDHKIIERGRKERKKLKEINKSNKI